MQEIEEGSLYSQRIVECLRQEDPMPHIMDDALNEASLRMNRLSRIICFVFMPPPQQALHTEAMDIHRMLNGRFFDEEGKQLKSKLCIRIEVIQRLLFNWLKKELGRDKKYGTIVARLDSNIYKFGVGANWRMIVYENLPRPTIFVVN